VRKENSPSITDSNERKSQMSCVNLGNSDLRVRVMGRRGVFQVEKEHVSQTDESGMVNVRMLTPDDVSP